MNKIRALARFKHDECLNVFINFCRLKFRSISRYNSLIFKFINTLFYSRLRHGYNSSYF
ncbi:hypothetical protein BMB171_C2873 [Bacillus thuringiensis BMB171]|nr:hypothetical protein BMB171_C2873 [Bacillus thuringiensis BMB171]